MSKYKYDDDWGEGTKFISLFSKQKQKENKPGLLPTMEASTPATYPPWPCTTPLGLPVLPLV